MQVGVMTFVLGQPRDVIEELNSGHEVLHHPVFADALAAVSHFPARKLLKLSLGFGRFYGGDVSFAGSAFLLDQFFRGLNSHVAILSCSRLRPALERRLFYIGQPREANTVDFCNNSGRIAVAWSNICSQNHRRERTSNARRRAATFSRAPGADSVRWRSTACLSKKGSSS